MSDEEIESLNTGEKEKKHLKILARLMKIDDYLIKKFFNVDSYKMQDEKIEVLDKLIAGKTPSEIENYYKILEKIPKSEETKNNITNIKKWD